MDTILKEKDYFTEVKDICKNENIEIIENSMDEYDCYITFRFCKDSSFFNRLFSLREKQYVFCFEKKEDSCLITVSGKEKLYEDISCILDIPYEKYSDIEEIFSFIEKVNSEGVLIINYYNGVNYSYEISDNIYGFAFTYYNFLFDGNRYHYQVRNVDVFYEVLKEINKNLDVYRKRIDEVQFILENKNYEKNTCLTDIIESFDKEKDKEIYIIFWELHYYLSIQSKDNLKCYRYDNERHFKNMIPEIIELYIKDIDGVYEEERNSCLGRSFYSSSFSKEEKLYIYNIDDEDVDFYLSYLLAISNNLKQNYEYNQDVGEKISILSNYGYVNIFLLCVSIFGFGVFVFIITLIILR